MHAAYIKQPRKWNRAVVAKALCEIDILITEARRTVARSSTSILLPDKIIDFESYMQDRFQPMYKLQASVRVASWAITDRNQSL